MLQLDVHEEDENGDIWEAVMDKTLLWRLQRKHPEEVLKRVFVAVAPVDLDARPQSGGQVFLTPDWEMQIRQTECRSYPRVRIARAYREEKRLLDGLRAVMRSKGDGKPARARNKARNVKRVLPHQFVRQCRIRRAGRPGGEVSSDSSWVGSGSSTGKDSSSSAPTSEPSDGSDGDGGADDNGQNGVDDAAAADIPAPCLRLARCPKGSC